jgi:large subunit ribosomal protein L9
MKILLKKSIRSLGRAGEIVNVRNGYARNFLLPKGFGVHASQANEALVETYTARRAQEEAEMEKTSRELAERINELEIVLHMKANASNHLYGSVNAGEIVTQLNNRHIAIEKSMVRLEEPIKELGIFTVAIHLFEGIEATLRLDIRDEHGEIPVLEGSLDLDDENAEEGDVEGETQQEVNDVPVEEAVVPEDATSDTTHS